MKVSLNNNRDIVTKIRKSIENNDGYCPCVLQKTPETKCMCKEFRDMMSNKTPGYCHCKLYVITLDDDEITEETNERN